MVISDPPALTPTRERRRYRGVKLDLSGKFPKGKTFVWWSITSATANIEVLNEFLGQSGPR